MIFYVLFGLPMGIIVQVPDLWGFIKSSWDMKTPIQHDKIFVVSRSAFEMFYQLIKSLSMKTTSEGGSIRAIDLINQVK